MKKKDLKKEDVVDVWVTKYALSNGIMKISARFCGDGMVNHISDSWHYYHGDEWHLTAEEAATRAEEMRLKKIETLKKQLKKLESKRFEVEQ